MKRSEHYEARFKRLSSRMERLLIGLIVGFAFLLLAGQILLQVTHIRTVMIETERREGAAHILQK